MHSSQEEAGTSQIPIKPEIRQIHSVHPLICPLMDGENYSSNDGCRDHTSLENKYEGVLPLKESGGRVEVSSEISSTLTNLYTPQATTCSLSIYAVSSIFSADPAFILFYFFRSWFPEPVSTCNKNSTDND